MMCSLDGLAWAVLPNEYEVIELKALSVGYAVPQHDFRVTVHSVFPAAINLKSGNRGRLISLVRSDCADLPQGMRLDTPAGFSFDLGLQPGENLFCQNSSLQDENKRLSINFRQAKYWKCKLPDLGTDGINQNFITAWNSVWQALNERQRLCGAEICAEELFYTDTPKQKVVTKSMGVLVRELVEAARNLNTHVEKIIARLIGLGQGLTPSGDDFLIGFLAGLCSTRGKTRERLKFLSELGKEVRHLSCYTNDISSTFLFYATQGQVSSKLANLLDAIAGGEGTAHFWQTVEEAMRVGHSSGMDTVTGLLVGLSTWGNGFPQIRTIGSLDK
jgi:hypothetical protein